MCSALPPQYRQQDVCTLSQDSKKDKGYVVCPAWSSASSPTKCTPLKDSSKDGEKGRVRTLPFAGRDHMDLCTPLPMDLLRHGDSFYGSWILHTSYGVLSMSFIKAQHYLRAWQFPPCIDGRMYTLRVSLLSRPIGYSSGSRPLQ